MALVLLVQAGNDFQQCRFASTIEAYDAYLCSVEEAEVDVFKYLFLILLDGLAQSNH